MLKKTTTLIVSKGVTNDLRYQAELRAIRGLKKREVALVECDVASLAAAIDNASGRVWVHLVGHHCATGLGEEVLHLERVKQAVALKRTYVRAPLSSSQMRATLAKPTIDFVFFNAAKTKTLANSLGVVAFGWSTACVDQGCVAFARAFYAALEDSFADAFDAAKTAISAKPHVIDLPTEDTAVVRKTKASLDLADPILWAKRRRRHHRTFLSSEEAAPTLGGDDPERATTARTRQPRTTTTISVVEGWPQNDDDDDDTLIINPLS